MIDGFGPVAPQQLAQLDFLVMAEAAEDGARRRDADPVAAVAKVVRQRRDHAQANAKAIDFIVAGRASGALERPDELKLPLEPDLHIVEEQIMLGPIPAD